MKKRKPISKKLRFEVFKRDEFTCQYCGATPPRVILECDHIDPVANGGSNDIDNLITACFDCNRGKSADLLSDVPKALKDRTEEIKEREAQILGYNKILAERRDRIENEAWAIIETLEGGPVESYNKKRLQSIKMFLEKMAFYDVDHAAEIASSKFSYTTNKAFKYFCGVCWRMIKERGADNA